MASRRVFLLTLAAAVAATGCAAPEEPSGLRGRGRVLRPTPEGTSLAMAPVSEPTAIASPEAVPTQPPPIVPVEAPRPVFGGGTEAQAHVIPLPIGDAPLSQPLPARRLVIPSLALDSRVIQIGTAVDRNGNLAWETAPFAVGHHHGTAGPGQRGNMVLSGHISSPFQGAVFSRLPELGVGEGLVVATDDRQFLYRVVDVKTVLPQEVSVMAPTEEPTATLITCVPDGIYSHRLVVTARLV